ncbi:hypothetical protein Pmani_011559 [Petrolisthes manimaculis]|uniref:Transposase n=1 Tax=Petrolisthes manimaculis TaxID=1843537 RepID=A0AAE1Q0H5_9EUCA|nr:hypothetical protein Pmani_011559 [Petrolisthes manimaculis]
MNAHAVQLGSHLPNFASNMNTHSHLNSHLSNFQSSPRTNSHFNFASNMHSNSHLTSSHPSNSYTHTNAALNSHSSNHPLNMVTHNNNNTSTATHNNPLSHFTSNPYTTHSNAAFNPHLSNPNLRSNNNSSNTTLDSHLSGLSSNTYTNSTLNSSLPNIAASNIHTHNNANTNALNFRPQVGLVRGLGSVDTDVKKEDDGMENLIVDTVRGDCSVIKEEDEENEISVNLPQNQQPQPGHTTEGQSGGSGSHEQCLPKDESADYTECKAEEEFLFTEQDKKDSDKSNEDTREKTSGGVVDLTDTTTSTIKQERDDESNDVTGDRKRQKLKQNSGSVKLGSRAGARLEVRGKIIDMWESGIPVATIAQQLGHSRTTIYTWITRWKEEGSLETRPRGGKSRITTPEEEAKILALVREQPNGESLTQGLKLSQQSSQSPPPTATTTTTTTTTTTNKSTESQPESDEQDLEAALKEKHKDVAGSGKRANAPEVLTTRAKMILLWQSGMSARVIAQVLGLSRNTVRKWISRWQKEGSILTRARTGRPRSTTPDQDAKILEVALSRPETATAVSITRDLKLSCCASTIERRLREHGIVSHIPAIPAIKEEKDKDEEEEVVETKPTPTDILATRARIIVLWEKGMSEAAIAQNLGHSRYTVRRWITRWQKDRSLVNKSRETRPRTSTKEKKEPQEPTDPSEAEINPHTTTSTPEDTTHDEEKPPSSNDSQPTTTE